MGVWIEMFHIFTQNPLNVVAPLVGVWIEIDDQEKNEPEKRSLPSWECGLKYTNKVATSVSTPVAPFVGVWIEIHPNV